MKGVEECGSVQWNNIRQATSSHFSSGTSCDDWCTVDGGGSMTTGIKVAAGGRGYQTRASAGYAAQAAWKVFQKHLGPVMLINRRKTQVEFP